MQRLVEPSPADVPILPVTPEALERWLDGRPREAAWVAAHGFRAQAGVVLTLPGGDGGIERVLFGLGESHGFWTWASLADGLPPGSFALEGLEASEAGAAALAFGLGCYRYSRYKAPVEGNGSGGSASLAWQAEVDRRAVLRELEGMTFARDLINTPAGDLGPGELAGAARDLAQRHGAEFDEIEGEELLTAGYPAVHAVGRAASRAPRLADLRWGDPTHPKVTLVGKGVIFDSGGLDLKPADGMKLMKKDMGGAAAVLGLAHTVMDAGLAVRLRVLVPAVENAVSGDAFRPLDVLATRAGKTVEVGNTDAEGRLILCDALAEADSEDPEVVIDFATLTGAARIALGLELPALFSTSDELAEQLLAAGRAHSDPLWRMPLHDDYRRHLESPVADLCNVSPGRWGGAITAALFLREFLSPGRVWAHVDTMGWNEATRPGRPVGGEALGLRAAFATLSARYATSP